MAKTSKKTQGMNDDSVIGSEYLGEVGSMRCYTCKLRGGLTDADSNWRLWNADMKVFRDGAGKGEEDEEFGALDEEIITKMERRRKAIVWFSVSEALREKHLTDMGGRETSTEDVMRRLFERVAPKGSQYKPLEKLYVEEHMRESMRKTREERRLRKERQARKGKAHD